ncbi:hypothetical protein HKCCSP123_04455 [Rhodobacterales bacterium HKCCSP123]|nr:hypothetical protein [Rhodobacterales bacterium HKCCSP123]
MPTKNLAIVVSFLALAVPAVAQQPVGIVGQEQACAGEFSMMFDAEMSSVRVNGHDESPAGNTVIFLQTADGAYQANCEVDDFGNVVEMVRTGG